MKLALLTIGDEILIGQTLDTNARYIAQILNDLGIELVAKRTVGDEIDSICKALHELSQEANGIITTGGLGPTKDDITKMAISRHLGVEMEFMPQVFDRIAAFFAKIERPMTDAHRQQAFMPQGVQLLTNKMGTAPGMWFQQADHFVCNLPGVPYEMKYLMDHEVIPRLVKMEPAQVFHRTLQTAGAGETQLARRIEDIESQLPSEIKIAYLPDLSKVRVRLTAKGSRDQVEPELDRYFQEVKDRLQEFIFGEGDLELVEALANGLREKKMTIGLAESCTGGHIAHTITSKAGSSQYFMGGIVAYANEVKINQLGVSSETLLRHGAVSEPTAIEMAKGVLDVLQTDVAIAVTGIAGPGGGTPEKPVGTIWMACAHENRVETLRIQASKNRVLNIRYATNVAINMMRKFLLTIK